MEMTNNEFKLHKGRKQSILFRWEDCFHELNENRNNSITTINSNKLYDCMEETEPEIPLSTDIRAYSKMKIQSISSN